MAMFNGYVKLPEGIMGHGFNRQRESHDIPMISVLQVDLFPCAVEEACGMGAIVV